VKQTKYWDLFLKRRGRGVKIRRLSKEAILAKTLDMLLHLTQAVGQVNSLQKYPQTGNTAQSSPEALNPA